MINRIPRKKIEKTKGNDVESRNRNIDFKCTDEADNSATNKIAYNQTSDDRLRKIWKSERDRQCSVISTQYLHPLWKALEAGKKMNGKYLICNGTYGIANWSENTMLWATSRAYAHSMAYVSRCKSKYADWFGLRLSIEIGDHASHVTSGYPPGHYSVT